MKTSFNLLHEPWIPVRRLDQSEAELSIRDVFAEAHTIRMIGGELPTQYPAILRLLLAILHRSTPTDGLPEERWSRLWERGEFDLTPIDNYLAPYVERFDLIHPTAPFYQVADLHTSNNEFFSLARIVLDMPTRKPFFATRTEGSLDQISKAEAARWVVNAQTFDSGQPKSGAVGDNRVKNGKGYPNAPSWCGRLGLVILEGNSFFETLLLNLVLTDVSSSDSALWERPSQTVASEARPDDRPLGPADLLTWQSRRIRLRIDGGVATGVLLANGDALEPHNLQDVEAMTAWERSENQEKTKNLPLVLMPKTHTIDRELWRGLGGLLNAGLDPRKSGQAAGVIEWIARLREYEKLEADRSITTHAIGVKYDGPSASRYANVEDIYDDALVLQTDVLANGKLRALAVSAVNDAEQAVRALGYLARNLALAAGSGESDGPSTRARATAYAVLDPHYRDWIRQITADSYEETVRMAWQRQVREQLTDLAAHLSNSAGLPAMLGRDVVQKNKTQFLNAAIAERYFISNLANALPLAFHTEQE